QEDNCFLENFSPKKDMTFPTIKYIELSINNISKSKNWTFKDYYETSSFECDLLDSNFQDDSFVQSFIDKNQYYLSANM
ncbi:4476_t:CDS:2, partial [Dentiscutata heterogama]